jgi:hypothetical protein
VRPWPAGRSRGCRGHASLLSARGPGHGTCAHPHGRWGESLSRRRTLRRHANHEMDWIPCPGLPDDVGLQVGDYLFERPGRRGRPRRGWGRDRWRSRTPRHGRKQWIRRHWRRRFWRSQRHGVWRRRHRARWWWGRWPRREWWLRDRWRGERWRPTGRSKRCLCLGGLTRPRRCRSGLRSRVPTEQPASTGRRL